MKKIIDINGSEVAFESNAATPIFYKQQFGSDFFGDLMRMSKAMSKSIKKNDDGEDTIDVDQMSWDEVDHFEMSSYLNYAWALAATAAKSEKRFIAPPVEWLAQFDSFPQEAIEEIMDLVGKTFANKKK